MPHQDAHLGAQNFTAGMINQGIPQQKHLMQTAHSAKGPVWSPPSGLLSKPQQAHQPNQGSIPNKDSLKISERFDLKQKLGQGTFSFIYQAFDHNSRKDVALKVEKKDKNKSILIFEFNVLINLKGLKHVCNVYDFVKNSEQNLIVMDLLGCNLAKVRKLLESNYSLRVAI